MMIEAYFATTGIWFFIIMTLLLLKGPGIDLIDIPARAIFCALLALPSFYPVYYFFLK